MFAGSSLVMQYSLWLGRRGCGHDIRRGSGLVVTVNPTDLICSGRSAPASSGGPEEVGASRFQPPDQLASDSLDIPLFLCE